jgi:hypothetical protein
MVSFSPSPPEIELNVEFGSVRRQFNANNGQVQKYHLGVRKSFIATKAPRHQVKPLIYLIFLMPTCPGG